MPHSPSRTPLGWIASLWCAVALTLAAGAAIAIPESNDLPLVETPAADAVAGPASSVVPEYGNWVSRASEPLLYPRDSFYGMIESGKSLASTPKWVSDLTTINLVADVEVGNPSYQLDPEVRALAIAFWVLVVIGIAIKARLSK